MTTQMNESVDPYFLHNKSEYNFCDAFNNLLNFIDNAQSIGNKQAETNLQSSGTEDILVFALMGQSNMSGRGVPEKVDLTPHPKVKKWKDGKLEPAIESVHGFDGRGEGVGPGLAFGKVLAENLSATIVLVPTAVGSTNIAKWSPGKELYDNALVQTQSALKNIPGARLAAVLWAQGESDSSSSKTAKKYKKKFEALVSQFRKDLGQDMPWLVAELSDNLQSCTAMKATHWEKINDAFKTCSVPIEIVKTNGFTTIDTLHYDSKSQRELGKRFAQAFLNLPK